MAFSTLPAATVLPVLALLSASQNIEDQVLQRPCKQTLHIFIPPHVKQYTLQEACYLSTFL